MRTTRMRPPGPLKYAIVANVMEHESTTCALVAASDFNAAHFATCDASGVFDYVIAVDAGFAELERIGRTPDLALGDFDSLGYVPKCKRVVRHPVKKDKSDLELALDRAEGRNFTDLVVYGALGGRLDHTVANLQLLARYAEEGANVTAIGPDCAARFVVGPDVYELPLLDEGTVSVFALTPEAHGVIERGMQYSINDETLSNRTTRGLSNELVGLDAAVAVEEGTLLVFHPIG